MSRDAKLVALFGVLSVVCSVVVGARLTLATDKVPVVAVQGSAQQDGQVRVQFLGDTMLGDAALPRLKRDGYHWPLADVREVLDADLVVANLEGPITTRKFAFDPAKVYLYTVDPAAARVLKGAGIDAVSLANNHAMDAGAAGLSDMLGHLHGSGIAAFGAGASSERADRPLMFSTAAGNVAVVGLGEDYGSETRAEEAQAGTAVLSPEAIQVGYDRAKRAGADWIVAMVHWGENYEAVDRAQRYWTKLFAAAGYDFVVGTGPHIVQPVVTVEGMPVIYSIGNFVFTTPGRFLTERTGVGVAATVTLRKDEAPSFAFRCLVTYNEVVQFAPRPCGAAQSRRTFATMSPDITMSGDSGRWEPGALAPQQTR